ncbi:shikimate dehydrogenase [Microbacterium sp. 2FI]|uniref:shikimate dehydrogenase n=1 Tax=Microbacterium sp. 2FI TaxID=2502193 RepID=UPI0010F76378|nr:shikimate dehydrogenase [Microbacterium sp. 2FI]
MVLGEPGLRVLSEAATRLEVWGDPIAHSRSPQLHAAAYSVLDLDWSYGRRQVAEAQFAAEYGSLDERWRGLSLTMPLKGAGFAATAIRDRRAELTGAVNTLVRDPSGARGFNTDVGGIVRALADSGVRDVAAGRIVGAGATATSALVALAELGARRVEVVARRPEAVLRLRALGDELGLAMTHETFDAASFTPADVTIATLPGGARPSDAATAALAEAGGFLLDVVYGQGPTTLGAAWARAGARSTSGLGMLLHQALLQVRAFTTGDVDTALDDEPAVLAAMLGALEADAT